MTDFLFLGGSRDLNCADVGEGARRDVPGISTGTYMRPFDSIRLEMQQHVLLLFNRGPDTSSYGYDQK